MFKNYFLTALRNLKKNKAFSAINILGLALGLTCSLLIFLWVRDERDMDKFNVHTDRLYTVYERWYTGGKIDAHYNTPGIMADEMRRVLPEVQYASGFSQAEMHTFQAGARILKEKGSFAGADFLKMFSYPLIAGDKGSALSTPVDMVISRDMADNLFGGPQNAMGKTIRYDDKKDFRVTAVFETLPENASAKFEYLINWHAFLEDNNSQKSWDNHGENTFIMLKEGANIAVLEKEVVNFLKKYATFDGDFHIELGLQRFDEMYLHSHFNELGQIEGGRIEYVRIFSIVAIFILLIACINFMNLTTARSVKRAKEIGVRKVVGALRSALIIQFIGEAIVLAFISIVLALSIVVLLLPVFNSLTQKQISFPVSHASFWIGIFGITLVTGIVSGSYPALFLSSFSPVKVLKGTLKLSGGNTAFRKGLVVSQFVLSIVLIIGTIVVSKQVNYIQTMNLGFDRENLIYLPQEGEFARTYKVFKDEALKMPGIQSVSRTEQEPTDIHSSTWGIDWEGKDPNSKPTFYQAGVGYDFARTMNIQVLQGHDFSKNFATDSIGYILNEEAVKQLGYKDPIGKPFSMWGRKATIVGVIKNFHFASLHSPVNPMILWLGEYSWGGNILVRTRPGQTKQALAGLGKLWKQLNPRFPFTYSFADEEYNNLYRSEQMAGKLSNCFAFLGIFISCLGLLGLAMFTAEQRTKEIGIRKVLGANAASLFGLLSMEFLWLVVISLFIASPLAWISMNKWLQGYAYRTDISWWMFMVAGIAAVLITLVTISFQTIKASLANPVKSLRSE